MEKRKQPETLRLRTAIPAFTVRDLEKTLAWYRGVLGFTTVDEFRHEDKLVGASVKAGDVSFMFGQDDFEKGTDRVKGVGFRIYCETAQDIDRIASDIQARGGTLLTEPTDQPWGVRDFSLEDPDGFKISISSLQQGE